MAGVDVMVAAVLVVLRPVDVSEDECESGHGCGCEPVPEPVPVLLLTTLRPPRQQLLQHLANPTSVAEP